MQLGVCVRAAIAVFWRTDQQERPPAGRGSFRAPPIRPRVHAAHQPRWDSQSAYREDVGQASRPPPSLHSRPCRTPVSPGRASPPWCSAPAWHPLRSSTTVSAALQGLVGMRAPAQTPLKTPLPPPRPPAGPPTTKEAVRSLRQRTSQLRLLVFAAAAAAAARRTAATQPVRPCIADLPQHLRPVQPRWKLRLVSEAAGQALHGVPGPAPPHSPPPRLPPPPPQLHQRGDGGGQDLRQVCRPAVHRVSPAPRAPALRPARRCALLAPLVAGADPPRLARRTAGAAPRPPPASPAPSPCLTSCPTLSFRPTLTSLCSRAPAAAATRGARLRVRCPRRPRLPCSAACDWPPSPWLPPACAQHVCQGQRLREGRALWRLRRVLQRLCQGQRQVQEMVRLAGSA